jgi:hypothetical protein
MSKNRGQSQDRAISRALVNRTKGITSDGKPIMKETRIITKWSDILGKMMTFKRSSCGHNRIKTKFRKRNTRPYHQLIGPN